jgi:hypothetical protein
LAPAVPMNLPGKQQHIFIPNRSFEEFVEVSLKQLAARYE